MDKEPFIGKNIQEIFPSLSNDISTKLHFVMDGLQDLQILNTIHLSNGSVKKVVWHLDPWKDTHGDTLGVMIRAEDVTKVKELEHELLKVKNILSEKSDIAKIGSWEYDVENELFEISEETKKIFKVKSFEKLTIDQLIRYAFPANTRDTVLEVFYNAVNNGIPWDTNMELCLPDNKMALVNTIGKPKYKNGRCNRIIGTVQIINEGVTATQQNTTPFLELMEELPVPALMIDCLEGNILEANNELFNLSGYTKLELGLKNYLDIVKTANRNYYPVNTGETRKNQTNIVKLLHKDGSVILCSAKEKIVENGKRLICVLNTLTDEEQYVIRLENQLRREEKSALDVMEYTHKITHNLKAHAINYNLIAELLETTTEEKEKQKLLYILKNSTKDLSDITKDLRHLVTVESNARANKQRVNINDWVFKAEQNLSSELKSTGAKIINEIPDSQKLSCNPVFLENILTNCISNSIKYRKPYKSPVITIATTIEKEHTVLWIEDNGQGMDLKLKGDKLFKIASSLGNNTDSKGTGLYMVKVQLELMDGMVKVESAPNKGTIIKLYFPHN